MKIKTKKQLNLPQLIEWAWENNVKGENFPIDQNEEAGIYFTTDNDFMVKNADFIRYNNTFTVEVEEVVDEDTEFKSMVEVTTDDLFAVWEHASISTWKNEYSKEFHAYIEGEFKLIWRDGKMVK